MRLLKKNHAKQVKKPKKIPSSTKMLNNKKN